MLRKQGLAAPVSARPDLPERSPALAVRRNRRTFTLADQVNLLVSAREADPDLGFMGRTMALCSPCREATPATGSNTSASTGHSRST